MAITPQTVLRLVKVPLEIDNKNQLTFENEQKQREYFLSLPHKEIQEIILKEYGLRVDNGTVNYDVSTLSVSIPATIKNSVDGMKLETYNKMIGYLK